MPTILLTRGVPGSGKSTFAKEWVRENPAGRVRINRDELRGTLYATGDKILSHAQEKHVSVVEKSIARDALAAGLDVIVDATNLNPRFVKGWFHLGHPVRFQDFPVTLDTALEQNAGRLDPIPEHVIQRMFKRYTVNGILPKPPIPDKIIAAQYEPNTDLTTAVLVDVDGTLAHFNGRGPFEWDKVSTDTVDPNVAAFVNALEHAHHIIVLSGRDGVAYEATADWLIDNNIRYDRLFMRAAGDTRPDDIVKRELFDTHIRDNWNVIGVIDDRPKVCRMWRAIGVKTFQVGDPSKEF